MRESIVVGPVRRPAAGAAIVVCQALLAAATLLLSTTAALAQGALNNGANHSGDISAPGEIDTWTFTAHQNDSIALSIGEVIVGQVDPGFVPFIRLTGPTGTLIASSAGTLAAQINVKAPLEGTYTVLVSSADAGNDALGSYLLTLARIPGTFTLPPGDEGGPMVNGADNRGTIHVGDLDEWTFDAAQGSTMAIAIGEVPAGQVDPGFVPWIRLYGPTGAEVGSNAGALAAQLTFTATLTGSYTVLVGTLDAGTDATGNYRLTLAQMPGNFVVPPGDEGGAMTAGLNHHGSLYVGDLDQWSVTANVNDTIAVSIGEIEVPPTEVDPGFVPFIRLYGPTGALVQSSAGNLVGQITARATLSGTYTVLVTTADAGTDAIGEYQLTLAKMPGPLTLPVDPDPDIDGGPMTPGLNHHGSLHLGDLDEWTFTAGQGDAIALSIGEVTIGEIDPGFIPWIRVFGPDGAQVSSATGNFVAQINATAPLTGTYAVLVTTADAGSDGTGQYLLTLAKIPGPHVVPPDVFDHDGGPMTAGENHQGAIHRGDLDEWTFTANKGDSIALSIGETHLGEIDPGFFPWIRLFGPTGSLIGSGPGNLVGQITVGPAPLTGTYTVLVTSADAGADGAGSYQLTLAKFPGDFVVPPGDQGGPMINLAKHPGTIHLGDLDEWTFCAAQGGSIALSIGEVHIPEIDPGFFPWIRLFGPTGALVASSSGNLSAQIAVNAPLSGTYTVLVASADAGADGTGDYELSVTAAGSCAAPVIVTPPAPRTIASGATATLTVVAQGSAPLSYQWFAGASGNTTAPVSNAIASSFTTPALTDTGTYWVRVSNPFGQADSPSVSVTVLALDRKALNYAAVTTGVSFVQQTPNQVVRLSRSGPATFNWTATPVQPWISVSPTSGSGPAELTIGVQFAPGLPPDGAVVGALSVTVAGAGAIGPIAVRLNTTTRSVAPIGVFETPVDGTVGLTGSIAVTGWALDDIAVKAVRIMREPVAGEGDALVFIGNAALIDGARPDVAAAFPAMPRNTRGGWGYLLLSNFLPAQGNGTFHLHAVADDDDGHSVDLGTKTIGCANEAATRPFGAIDTPDQGQTVSGVVANFGWVLARTPAIANPLGGGTVRVIVDGADVGSPGGWTSRPDLSALFPAITYPGITNALGVLGLDTRRLTNGVHTIAWFVRADNGQADGIGSRFFTVANGGAGSLTAAEEANAAPPWNRAIAGIDSSLVLDGPAALAAIRDAAQPGDGSVPPARAEVDAAVIDRAPVRGRQGFALDAPLRPLGEDAKGRPTLHGEELGRFELRLRDERTPPAGRYSGYLRVGDALGPLPIGSRLDPVSGTFTWLAGPGYLHGYDFVFVRWADGRAAARQEARIVINPKGSNRVGPQTTIDLPRPNAQVTVPFIVGGWAIDPEADWDTGVDTLHVWAYPVGAPGRPIFVGAAVSGGARPDVGAIFGDRFEKSGFGLVVDGLPPGTYDLAVFALSSGTGTFAPARVVRITVR